MTEPIYRRNVELLEAELGDELVTLDAEAGRCFGFNEVATSVWRLLATPRTAREIADSLLAEYDVDTDRCAVELNDLLLDMTARGLVASR